MKGKRILSLFLCSILCLNGPISVFANEEDSIPTFGICNGNIQWTMDEDTMTFSGTGTLEAGDSWDVLKDVVKHVVVGEGIDTIAADTFKDFSLLEDIKLPSTLTTIKEEAFMDCENLNEVEIKSTSLSIQSNAFNNVSNTCEFKVYYPEVETLVQASVGTSTTTLIHEWSTEYTVDSESTCFEAGQMSYHCIYCNEINTESIQSLDLVEHTWSDVYTVDQEPTTSTIGLKSIHCTVCGETQPNSVREIPMLVDGTWKQTSKGYKFYYANGDQAVDEMVLINGKYYIFDENGYRCTGWITFDGNTYYANSKGVLYNGLKTISEKKYYFDNYVLQKGFVELNGNLYLFSTKTGAMLKGFRTVSGSKYYFNEEGCAVNGWNTISGKKYYFDDYKVIYGFQELNDKYYFFNEDGSMYKGFLTLEDGTYYFNSKGVAVDGLKTISEKQYYFIDHKLQKGLQEIDGELYYFSKKTGAMMTGFRTVEDNTYYFNEEGIAVDGFVKIDKKKYYFVDKIMQTGFVEMNDFLYYFNETGDMATGFKKVDGKSYYFNKSGHALDGWQTIKEDDYYFVDYIMQKGLMEFDGELCYFGRQTGIMKKKTWVKLDGNQYYFNKEGHAVDGLKTISNQKYYFVDRIMQTGLQTIDGKEYYFSKKSGAMKKGWVEINKKRYYFGSKGYMLKGRWITVGGYQYYVHEDGHMARDEFIGKKYVMSNGRVGYKTLPKSTLISKINNAPQGYKTIDSNYRLSSSKGIKVKSIIKSLEARGRNVSFVMIDLQSGEGVVYNPNSVYYIASSIKGPYIVACSKYNEARAKQMHGTIEPTIVNSSNEGYMSMFNNFGPGVMNSFKAYCGANELNYGASSIYPYMKPKTLAKLWIGNYWYFFNETNSSSAWTRSVFTHSYKSYINAALSRKYTVYSKPGWIGMAGLIARNDAGIVMSKDGPYIVAIMSTAYGYDNELASLALAIDDLHTDMMKEYYTE